MASQRAGAASPAPRPVALLITALVAALIAGPIGYLIGRPDAGQVAIADMQEADAKRDVQQIGELTASARKTAEELNPVLSGVVAAFPKDPAANPRPAGPAPLGDLAEWQRVLQQAVARHADTPSGTTATNVARGGFRSAVNTLAAAVDTYAAAEKLPADARQPIIDLATRQRSAGIAMWSVAATQLDQLNIDAGNGHQHVYLSSTPGEGAISPDGVPEGPPQSGAPTRS
ncbi:hypothetical protein DQ384_17250 [Sphaerisporangium album]|uniref:Uncharacterized protein n=1 Tax=Sphaerisporangium album TaxID=509200 RepID=A0A367FHQ8_9ACTN|nr:hypothetical protein DQ384_17250 [Sphaerisporangium album]